MPAVRSLPPRPPAAADAAAERIDTLLEQRFAAGNRDAMARQLAEHDRLKRPAPPPPGKFLAALRPLAQGKPRVRCSGAIPPQLQALLEEWLPALHAHGSRTGLAFTSAQLEFHVFDRAAYEAAHGVIPKGVSLPASSYQFNPLYRHYVIRLVLPPAVQSLEQLLAVVRTVLTRLYGDVFLREEVYPLAPYKEDELVQGLSVGLVEQIQVLAQLEGGDAGLDGALAAFAAEQGLSMRRAPAAVRKAFFADLERRAERDELAPSHLSLIAGLFEGYLDGLKADLPRAIVEHIAIAEALNRQVTFLPPHEWPDYAQLTGTRPAHYLRAAKLRLEFILEALAALLEDFDALEDVARTPSPLLEERIQGFLRALESEHLARPYLVPNARLSEELQSKLNAFPLEVHAILTRLPPAENKQRQFDALSQRMRNALHQRLYHALVLLRHAVRQREAGKAAAFKASPAFQTLKGYAANFRLRLPLLRNLFVRLGVIVDLAEASGAAPGTPAGRVRFPQQPFTRAWGQFAAHLVAGGWLAERRQKGFDPSAYWGQVDAGLREAAVAGNSAQARVAYLLRRYHLRSGEPDLGSLVGQLKGSSGTFRFAVHQAAQEPKALPRSKAGGVLEALDEIVAALRKAHQALEKHAMEVGADGRLR